MATDKYQILGVSSNATIDEIRAAYLRLARAHHPDLNPRNAKAESDFKAIQLAYETLVDPKSRRQFDLGPRKEPVVEAREHQQTRADFYWTQHGAHDPHFDINASHRAPRTFLHNVVVAGFCLSILLSAGYGVYWMSESTVDTATVDFADLLTAERVFAEPQEEDAQEQVSTDHDVMEEVLNEIQGPINDIVAPAEQSFSVKLEEAASEVVAALNHGELLESGIDATNDSLDVDPYGADALAENVSINALAQSLTGLDSFHPSLPSDYSPSPLDRDSAFDAVVAASAGVQHIDSASAMLVGGSWPEFPSDFSLDRQDLIRPELTRPWELNRWNAATPETREPLIRDLSLAEQIRQKRVDLLAPANASGSQTYNKTLIPSWQLATKAHVPVSDPASTSFSSLYARRNGVQTSVHPAATTSRRQPPTAPGQETSGKYSWDTVTGNLQVAPLSTYSPPSYSPPTYRTPSLNFRGYYYNSQVPRY